MYTEYKEILQFLTAGAVSLLLVLLFLLRGEKTNRLTNEYVPPKNPKNDSKIIDLGETSTFEEEGKEGRWHKCCTMCRNKMRVGKLNGKSVLYCPICYQVRND